LWELGDKLKVKLQILGCWIIDVITNVKKRRGRLGWPRKSIKRGLLKRPGLDIGVARKNVTSL
jgi:hypothetical protein